MIGQRMRTADSNETSAQELRPREGMRAEAPATRQIFQPKRARGASQSALQMQKMFGNRYVQRALFLARQEDGGAEVTSDVESSIDRARGGGQGMDHGTRTQMESAFGADFSGVRIHTGAESHSLNRAVNAVAFTTGRDIFFRDGAYAPGSSGGKELLAHELTHVVQQSIGAVEGSPMEPGGVSVSDPSDRFEKEAEHVAERVMATNGGEHTAANPEATAPVAGLATSVQRDEGDDDDGWLGSVGSFISNAGSSVASGVGSLVDTGSSLVSGAGSAIASGVGSVVDAGSSLVSDAGSAIASGAESAVDVGSSVASNIYGGMKSAGKAVRRAGQSVEGGIGDLVGMSKEGWNALADSAKGIPVLEQLASGAAWVGGTAADITGGVLEGATGLVGGVVGAVADPVDTAIGLEGLAEHARMFPGMPNPLQIAHGLYNVVANGADLGEEANRTLNPLEIMKGDFNTMKGLASGIAKPYMEAYGKGNYGEMVGRGAFDIGMLLSGVGEAEAAGALEEGGEAVRAAGDLGTAGEVGEGAGAVEEIDGASTAATENTGQIASGPPSDPYDVEAWNKYYEENPNAGRSVGAAANEDPAVVGEGGESVTDGEGPVSDEHIGPEGEVGNKRQLDKLIDAVGADLSIGERESFGNFLKENHELGPHEHLLNVKETEKALEEWRSSQVGAGKTWTRKNSRPWSNK